MTRFHYTAVRNGGEEYRGSSEAVDRFELYATVRREGGKIISVEEERPSSWASLSYWNERLSTVPEMEKIMFARNLGAMITAGLALSRAMSVIERQTKNAKFRRIVSSVADDVRRGTALNDALRKYPNIFSTLFVAMVRAGEESGDIPKSLATISTQMEQNYTLKKKIKSAMIYPSIIVIAIFGIGALMLTQVVPTLAQTFDELGAQLPASTRAVIAVSDFLTQHYVLALLLFVLIVSSFVTAMRTRAGKRSLDWVLLHLPVISGITREVNAARTARTLGSVLASGVDMLTAIGITREVVQNSYFKSVLAKARNNVERGVPLSSAFTENEDLYPALVGEMIAVGEETGQLSEMLVRLAEYYETEVTRKTKDMSTIIEPFLMVFIGAAVGFFAVSMISPIYSLSENI